MESDKEANNPANQKRRITLNKTLLILQILLTITLFIIIGILFYQNNQLKNALDIQNKLNISLSKLATTVAKPTSSSDTPCSTAEYPNINQNVARFYQTMSKLYSYFEYLSITRTKNDKDIGNLYTSYWFWCGGSSGERFLPAEYEQYLIPIGKMNQQEVYTLSEKTPLPKDVH